MNNFDPYWILGLNQGCSQNSIKKAYRHLAKKYHPDKNPLNSDKFIKLQIAYEMLMGKQSLKEQTGLTHNELKQSYNTYENNVNARMNNQYSQGGNSLDQPYSDNIHNNPHYKSEQRDQFKQRSQSEHRDQSEPRLYNQRVQHHQPNIHSQQNTSTSNNTLKHNLEDLQTKISNCHLNESKNKQNINFETVEDIPISKSTFNKVLQEYMKKRNIKSITKIFDNSFDLSIFNQIYVDLKKGSSTELIIKDPVAYNSTSVIKFSTLDNNEYTIDDYNNIFKNQPKNPEDVLIKTKYRSDNTFTRDDILEDNYYSNIKKKINAYNNNLFY